MTRKGKNFELLGFTLSAFADRGYKTGWSRLRSLLWNDLGLSTFSSGETWLHSEIWLVILGFGLSLELESGAWIDTTEIRFWAFGYSATIGISRLRS